MRGGVLAGTTRRVARGTLPIYTTPARGDSALCDVYSLGLGGITGEHHHCARSASTELKRPNIRCG